MQSAPLSRTRRRILLTAAQRSSRCSTTRQVFGIMPVYENQGNVHDQITSVTGESSVDMSFSLVFHSRFPGDLSVRQQMERILKMIRQSPTRQVGFRWEGIQMVGRLVSFSGEYDMFDASGVPVSGHMDLTIETSAKLERTSRTIARLEESENRNV